MNLTTLTPESFNIYKGYAGIYKIKNIKNRMQYIGSTMNLQLRLRCHLISLRNHKHPNDALMYEYLMHGEHNYEMEIVEMFKKSEACLSYISRKERELLTSTILRYTQWT